MTTVCHFVRKLRMYGDAKLYFNTSISNAVILMAMLVLTKSVFSQHTNSFQSESTYGSVESFVSVYDRYLGVYRFHPGLFFKDQERSEPTQLLTDILATAQKYREKNAYYYWNQLFNLPTRKYYLFLSDYLTFHNHFYEKQRHIPTLNESDMDQGYLDAPFGCFLIRQISDVNRKLDPFNHVPEFFKYITVLESGLHPIANDLTPDQEYRSDQLEKGLWQFMAETAQSLQLKVQKNQWGIFVDERLDPKLTTRTAFQYFQKIFTKYENWNMIFAHYNQGGTKIAKLTRAVQSQPQDPDLILKIWRKMGPVTRSYYRHVLSLLYFLHYFGEGAARPQIDPGYCQQATETPTAHSKKMLHEILYPNVIVLDSKGSPQYMRTEALSYAEPLFYAIRSFPDHNNIVKGQLTASNQGAANTPFEPIDTSDLQPGKYEIRVYAHEGEKRIYKKLWPWFFEIN